MRTHDVALDTQVLTAGDDAGRPHARRSTSQPSSGSPPWRFQRASATWSGRFASPRPQGSGWHGADAVLPP
jgi:hypothetical protein